MTQYCPRCGEDGDTLTCERCGAKFCTDCARPREFDAGLCKTCLTTDDVMREEGAES